MSQLKQLHSLVQEGDPIRILSVAQFRPEKDHPLMLQAIYELRNLLVKNEALWSRVCASKYICLEKKLPKQHTGTDHNMKLETGIHIFTLHVPRQNCSALRA